MALISERSPVLQDDEDEPIWGQAGWRQLERSKGASRDSPRDPFWGSYLPASLNHSMRAGFRALAQCHFGIC